MPKVLIVDDEVAALSLLSDKITKINSNIAVRKVSDPTSAYEIILQWKPDILFLDVQMPKMNGFELLSQIPTEERNFSLVFCTAYSEYAINAFKEAAIDYLLKPVDEARLEIALNKAFKDKEQKWKSFLNGTAVSSEVVKIIVKHRGKHLILAVNNILYFTSEAHETIIIQEDGREYISDLSLNQLESMTHSNAFYRSHRGYLINLNKISSLDSKTNEIQFEKSTKKAFVSKRKKTELSNLLKQRTK